MTSLGSYPLTLVEPIWLKERAVGQRLQDFVDMQEVDFIPDNVQEAELMYWSWIQEKILLLGSTSAREVQIRYRSGLKIPQTVNDTIGVLFGELYMSFRTAALAAGSNPAQAGGGKVGDWTAQANTHLETIIRMASKEGQNLPVKRKGYHRGSNKSVVRS